jgi:hypothetical protein
MKTLISISYAVPYLIKKGRIENFILIIFKHDVNNSSETHSFHYQ